MPIDWATVNWTFVVLMGVFAFVAALLGSLISFRNRFWGAVIGGILFAAIIVFWNHYPFFFNDTATTAIYTLSLHDALPI